MTISAIRTTPPQNQSAFRKSTAAFVLFIAFGAALLCGKTANAQYFPRESPRESPVGSWQTSLDIPSFGNASITVLLSFTSDGIVIETDTPTAGPVFFGSSALANGHGAWRRTGRTSFEYVYLKEIYAGTGAQGVALGTARSTATADLSSDGKTLEISNVSIIFTAANGSVLAGATGTGAATRISLDN